MRKLLVVVTALSAMAAQADDFADWSLEDKLGQLLMVGYRPEQGGAEQIQKLKPAGVVLFSWSMPSVEATHALTTRLRALAKEHVRAPLFIATDHEGGKVLRLRRGVTVFPDALAVGATGDAAMARQVGAVMGRELSALGLNMNLAPVLDVGNARSFLENRVWGDQPDEVGPLTAAFVAGTQSQGVLAVAKHFPGHGSSRVDAHFELPIKKKDWPRLWREDLEPFRDVLREGHLQAMMTAHVEIPAIERGPASLSPKFLQEILRDKMGFDGLVLTDDVEMGALATRAGKLPEDLALQTLKAGADIVLIVWSRELQMRVLERLKKAYVMGEIDDAWLTQKLTRIQRVKKEFLRKGTLAERKDWREQLRKPAALRLVREISRRAIHWEAGPKAPLLARLGQEWSRSWEVFVPENHAAAWSRLRAQDRVHVLRRAGGAPQATELRERLQKALAGARPVLVMTAPRASGNELLFAVIRQELGRYGQKAAAGAPVIWAHQGSKPVKISIKADDLKIGIVTLHASTIGSVQALGRYLKREGAGGHGAEFF